MFIDGYELKFWPDLPLLVRGAALYNLVHNQPTSITEFALQPKDDANSCKLAWGVPNSNTNTNILSCSCMHACGQTDRS
jgi:hypothetical protein